MGNTRMFTGREYDAETSLYYYRARYYSPTTGRFLQRDPVGYTAGINLYSYCSNNPINFVDPRGLSKEFLKGIAWGIGKTLIAMAVGGAIVYLAIQVPPLAFLLHGAAPWLLGAGALYGGTQIGRALGGVGWGGESLSARQRGELLGGGAATVGLSLVGAANLRAKQGNLITEYNDYHAPTRIEKKIAIGNEVANRKWGGSSYPEDNCWSPANPASPDYNSAMGIPTDKNTGEFFSRGTLKAGVEYYKVPAAAYGENAGGGEEWIILDPSNDINLNSITMP